MPFKLHKNLEQKTFLIDFPLCTLLLEDEKNTPWIFLVPRREDVLRMMDLSLTDQYQLIRELDFVQKVFWELFSPKQINVAAIGNKTPQLHIHVIARYENDPAWPGTVWDHPFKKPYEKEEKRKILSLLKKRFALFDR